MRQIVLFLSLLFALASAAHASDPPDVGTLDVHVTIGELATGRIEGLIPGEGPKGTLQSISSYQPVGFPECIETGPETVHFQILRDHLATILTRSLDDAGLEVRAKTVIKTTSGNVASLSALGELPMVVPQPNGKSSIEYKKVGTELVCVPLILGSDRIRLEVRPTVSTIDVRRCLDETVPAIRNAFIDTAVELNVGDTLVLAGLPQQQSKSELVIMIRIESADTPRVALKD